MGNTVQRKGIVTLTEAEAALGSEFEIIKSYYADKGIMAHELLKGFFGEGTPNTVLTALYNVVDKPIADRYFFSFEELASILAILKKGTGRQKAQLMFAMLQQNDVVLFNNLSRFGQFMKVPLADIQAARKYFTDPENLPISEEEFIKVFLKLHKENTLFSWIDDLAKPYKGLEDAKENEAIANRRRLAAKKTRAVLPPETEKLVNTLGLDDEVIEGFRLTYLDFQGKSLLKVSALADLLKQYGVQDPLASLLAEKCLRNGEVTLHGFVEVFSVLTQPNLLKKRNELLFSLYAVKNGQMIKVDNNKNRDDIENMMKCWAKKDKKVIGSIELLHKRLQHNLTKQQFLDFTQREAKSQFDLLTKLHYMPYIDFAFPIPSLDIQRVCIQFLLECEDDPQEYINKHLKEGMKYCMIKTAFWSAWTQYIGWQGARPKGTLDKDIELDVPREKGHLKKLSDSLVYPYNFVLIPEKVYQTFRKWYASGGGWPVSRKVIKYKEKRPELYNPNALRLGRHRTKFAVECGEYKYELDLHKYFFLGFRIHDDGEFPEIPRLSLWQRITGEKKTLPSFVELYISRKSRKKPICALLNKLKEMMVTERGPNLKVRMFLDRKVLDSKRYNQSLEDYFLEQGEVGTTAYIEVALPNGIWPTDTVAKKAIVGYKPLTNGLNNLGNTCYMNAPLQCLVNTKYIKEYLTEGPSLKWTQHINLYNRMGRRGELIEAFAKLTKDMWTSPDPSVKPREFKETVGKFKEEFRGNEQQDAQEFLTFLIDGLHEEVNLVLEKPYVNFPDAYGKDILDVANECWSLNLLRNWSLFSFLFTGLLGSELSCKKCESASWSFEPFMSLSLPITVTSLIPINVVVAPLPSKEAKIILTTLLVNKTDKVEALIKQLYQMKNMELKPESPCTELVVCRVSNVKVAQIFGPGTKIDMLEPFSPIKEIYAFEIVTEIGREQEKANGKMEDINTMDDTDEGASASVTGSLIADKYSSYNKTYTPSQSLTPQKDFPTRNPKPREFFTHVLNRTIVYNPRFVWKRYEALICGNPTLLLLNTDITNYELYERAWESASRYLKHSSKYLTGGANPWWKQVKSSPKHKSAKRPFIIRLVNITGDTCPKCSWREQCLGCTIPPDHSKLSLNPGDYIALDWYLDVYQDDYQVIKDLEKHESVEETRKFIQKPISIYDVINKFTSAEELSSARCGMCKKVGLPIKKLTILKLPMILTIHLKRYKENLYSKNNALVEFPFEGLDLNKFFTTGSEFHETHYDLYAVVNHYGLMSAGHYTAYINTKGHWYCYDDAHPYEVSVSDMTANIANAYMLFYIRKDIKEMEEKEWMERIMPKLETPFKGKPVKTKMGFKGYIKDIREDMYCKYVIKCFGSNLILYLRYCEKKKYINEHSEKDIEWETQAERLRILKQAQIKHREVLEKEAMELQKNDAVCNIF